MSPVDGRHTRRTVLAAAIGGGIAGGLISRAGAAPTISQAVAKYQDHPNGQQRCEICLQFRPPSSCNIVEGTISPTGWCQFFAARENAH